MYKDSSLEEIVLDIPYLEAVPVYKDLGNYYLTAIEKWYRNIRWDFCNSRYFRSNSLLIRR